MEIEISFVEKENYLQNHERMSIVKKEKSKVFEMVLSSPGMTESCKISLKISRQNVLVLAKLIESGILEAKPNFEDELFSSIPENSVEEFKIIHEEMLKKSGLTEFYEKLKTF
jgi:hypothetical protein